MTPIYTQLVKELAHRDRQLRRALARHAASRVVGGDVSYVGCAVVEAVCANA